jgi:predicted enzyme related to lactoylglutathione lyase
MKASKKSSAKKSAAKPAAKSVTRKSDPVVHFEMPAEDRKRMSKFYTNAFGWKTQMLGEEMGNYTLATTVAEVDKTGRPKRTGVINGGFYNKSADMPAQYPSLVIAVDDIKKSMKKLTKAGGKVIGEPMEIPGFGMYVSFFDTEGNRVSIMEPTMEMKEKAKKK